MGRWLAAYCAISDERDGHERRRCVQSIGEEVVSAFILLVALRRLCRLARRPRPLVSRDKWTVSSLIHWITSVSVFASSLHLLVTAVIDGSIGDRVVTPVLDTVAFLYYAILLAIERRSNVAPCGCLRLGVTLRAVLAIPQLSPCLFKFLFPAQLDVLCQNGVGKTAVQATFLVGLGMFSAGTLLPHLRDLSVLEDKQIEDDDMRELLRDHMEELTTSSPFDRAGFLSRISYHWISPIICLGQSRRLEIHDIPQLPRRDTTALAAKVFRQAYGRERKLANPSFLRLLWNLYGYNVIMFALWSAFNKAIGLGSPVLIKLFLEWAGQKHPSLQQGYALATAMIARAILAAVSGTQYGLAWKRFEIRVQAGLRTAIYDRTLSLNSSAKRKYGMGRITNFISVDLGRLVGMPGTVFDMVLIPVEIAVALVLLSREVSYAFIAGLVVLALMLPIQTVLGGKIQQVTRSMLHFRDQRVNLTNESLKAIKTLKLLGWISSFLTKMESYRSLEMGRLTVRKYLDALCVFFWASTPVIVQTSVFATVIYTGHDLTAASAFTAVSLLDRLIYPMNYFPWIINGFLEARVSALRIREFLFSSVDDEFQVPSSPAPMLHLHKGSNSSEENEVVTMRNCRFTWSPENDRESGNELERPLIDRPNDPSTQFGLSIHRLELKQDQIYVVCGAIGSGKTSLLMALLGEMPLRSIHPDVSGPCEFKTRLAVGQEVIAYAPQSPWLFAGSVRENITLQGDDHAIDDLLYHRVLESCDLQDDLNRNMDGERTSVSENGSNFSGGQQLRINMARALYQRASLYLLDDPFSGLDARTAATVVRNCFGTGRTPGKTSSLLPPSAIVVLVTHSIHLLDLFPPERTNVIVMENGKVVQIGKHHELKQDESSKFSKLLAGMKVARVQTADVAEADRDRDADAPSANKPEKQEEIWTEEKRELGHVHLDVWRRYGKSIGGGVSVGILLALAIMQLSRNGLDWWLAYYTNYHRTTALNFANVLLIITAVNCVSVLFRSFLFAYGGLQAAKLVYAALVTHVFQAPLVFFDQTPIGRILNRLSGDTYSVDESLPFILNIFLKDLADVLGTLGILLYGNVFVLLLLLPLSFVYARLQRNYRPTSRHVKRLDSVTQSPLLSKFTDTLNGLVVIRALRKHAQYRIAYEQCLNLSQRTSFLSANTGAWFGIRLDLLGISITSFVALFAVMDFSIRGQVSPGILGLTLTYALPIVSKINTALGSFIDTEREMIAVERVKEYTDLPSEEDFLLDSTTSRDSFQQDDDPGRVGIAVALAEGVQWPVHGIVEIRSLSVEYGSASSSTSNVLALKNVTCDIEAGETIGICGRTGAGKSTFLNALFRAVRWRAESRICIDGTDISSLPLSTLRSALCYIPQEAVLFSGSVRSNLDPTQTKSDSEIWRCLTKCQLDQVVARLPRGLDSHVEADEATFSKGQAQLLCIARALLRSSKLVCMDEATASIDFASEKAIHKTLQEDLASSTVLIVAHRLHTIMDCDRVLLFENGELRESGPPQQLAQIQSSAFHSLLVHLTPTQTNQEQS